MLSFARMYDSSVTEEMIVEKQGEYEAHDNRTYTMRNEGGMLIEGDYGYYQEVEFVLTLSGVTTEKQTTVATTEDTKEPKENGIKTSTVLIIIGIMLGVFSIIAAVIVNKKKANKE